MSTAPNPLAQMAMAALQARSNGANPAAPGSAPTAASGGDDSGSDAGDQYTSMISDVRGADPGALMRQLKQMKAVFAVMMVQNLERLPNVAGKLSKLIPQIDQVIKEVQQASTVNSAIRQPIQMGAAMPSPQAPNSGPQPGMGM